MSDDLSLPEASDRGSVAGGFGFGVGLNVLQAVLTAFVITQNGGYAALFIGIGGFGAIQLIYAVPIFFYLRSRKKTETAKGLAIEASMVVLCSAACWTIFSTR